MTTDQAIDNLTQQTTDLLAVFQLQKSAVDTRIAAAVLTSQNAAQIPLVTITTAMIRTQTMMITQTGVI